MFIPIFNTKMVFIVKINSLFRMAILNKYKKKWKTLLLLRKDRYDDFVLSLDNTKAVPLDGKLTERCLIDYVNINNPECIIDDSSLTSDSQHTYEHAINNDLLLKNIGFTGIDTSTVKFDKDNTSMDEFIDIIQTSTFTIPSGDTRLHLTPVTGNTKLYDYPCEIVYDDSGDTYYKFNGGFLQGFYESCDKNYKVLPQYINGAWNIEFVIRPRGDYEESGNTINSVYPDNSGIFFYMGTRAENKFVEYFGCEEIDKYPVRGIYEDVSEDKKKKTPLLVTSEGHIAESGLEYDVNTDNGYLIYDRTCDGYTTDTWNKGDILRLILKNRDIKVNRYQLLNRTCTGFTTDSLEAYLEEHPEMYVNKKCDIIRDLIGNAFALKINTDGSIGYKYLIRDCNNEEKYTIAEENGFPGAILENNWNCVNVMFKILNGVTDDCGVPLGERRMKIYIYINGYLKFVSKELPEFNFRELNDFCDKQEGVAFNISLGGGTQGLIESMWLNKMNGSKHIFPIESNFAGSFIGDIRSFKFYDCQLQYNEIWNNYMYEIGGIIPESGIDNNTLYYGFDIDFRQVVQRGDKMSATKDIRTKYISTSEYDNAHFYVVVSEKYTGTLPAQFTCGGAPMVMFERRETIGGKKCIVYESGEIYAPGTELLILSDNL